MSAVAVGSASAETELKHQWLLVHTQSGIHLLLASPLLVESEGLVLLTDTKVGIFHNQAVTVHCHGYDLGTVGPHGLDLVKSITLEPLGTKPLILCLYNPAPPSGTCDNTKMPDAEAINLPWHTQLVLRGGILYDLVLGHGGGRPGWRVTCINAAGGTTVDTCEEEAGLPDSLEITNEVNGSGVLGTFNPAKNPKSKCSEGGEKSGEVSGTVLTQSPSSTLILLVSPLD
jgi:hypothetical protein